MEMNNVLWDVICIKCTTRLNQEVSKLLIKGFLNLD